MDRFVDAHGTIVGYKKDEFNLDQINQGRLLFPLLARTKDARYRTAIPAADVAGWAVHSRTVLRRVGI